MTTPDLINGLYEPLGALFVLNHCLAARRDRSVKGVSLVSSAYFMSWGAWNLYYYPSLGQWASFAGGVTLTAANLVYLGHMIYYRRRAT